jgi:hypothetical protein
MAVEKKISELTAKTTELQPLDLLEVSEWNGATYDTKSISGSGLILHKKVSLAAVQITNGNSVPVSLIAAPGAGKVIEVVSAMFNFQYGTTAFDSGSATFELITNTATTEQFRSAGILNGTSNVFRKLDQISSTTTQIVANEPLNFALTGADATVGDSTMDLYINYRIITL